MLSKISFIVYIAILSNCQSVWIQIRPDILLDLIWVPTVCKGYQQTRLANKELIFVWFLWLLFVWFDYVPVNIFQSCRDGSSLVAQDKVSCSRTQHRASGEAQTRNVSSKALYHLVITLFSLVCGLTSTVLVMWRRSVNLTTFFFLGKLKTRTKKLVICCVVSLSCGNLKKTKTTFLKMRFIFCCTTTQY